MLPRRIHNPFTKVRRHALAQKLGCAFLETLAKTGTNIEKVFLELAKTSKLEKHESSSAPPAALYRGTCQQRFPIRDHKIRRRVRGGECASGANSGRLKETGTHAL